MISAFRRFLIAHFETYRRLGKWPFLWRISLEGLAVPLALGLALKVLFHLGERTDLADLPLWKLLVEGVVVGPFIETIFLQVIPVALVRRLRGGFWVQVLASTIIFAAAHFSSGIATVICAGLLSGFYIAFTYVHWRQTSLRSAIWMTTGMHALHNLVIFAIAGAVGK